MLQGLLFRYARNEAVGREADFRGADFRDTARRRFMGALLQQPISVTLADRFTAAADLPPQPRLIMVEMLRVIDPLIPAAPITAADGSMGSGFLMPLRMAMAPGGLRRITSVIPTTQASTTDQ